MNKNQLITALPSSQVHDIHTLIEHRKAITWSHFELQVFETFQPSAQIPLRFDDLVIINMLKGRKVMHLPNQSSFSYLPGETLVLPASVAMKIDFPDAHMQNPTQCSAITIEAQKIQEVLDYLLEFFPNLPGQDGWHILPQANHFANTPEIAQLVHRLYQISQSTELHKDVLADIVLKELLIRIMQTQNLLVLEQSPTKNGSAFHYIKSYIQENISEKLTVQLLSEQVGMSQSTLFRAFKNEFGLSPMEYIIQERLGYAKRLLGQYKNVKEACFGAGFSDVNYFIRLFKKRIGMTPGEFIRAAY